MGLELSDLKGKLLELLKRDEEFRYAVIGLIGLDKIFEELRKLREDFNKLYEKSLEHDKKTNEIINKFDSIENKLKTLKIIFH